MMNILDLVFPGRLLAWCFSACEEHPVSLHVNLFVIFFFLRDREYD